MAKLVYGLNQSLDGYVDHLEFRPSPALFRHFIEQVRDLTGSVYGRRMYEVMLSRNFKEIDLFSDPLAVERHFHISSVSFDIVRPWMSFNLV